MHYQPDIILLDIGLPGLDGYQIAKHVRGQPQTQKAILIAITGFGQESDKDRAREAGFDHYLVKPVDPTQLQNLLTLLVERE
jgi:CheY-like chemotaxis protein